MWTDSCASALEVAKLSCGHSLWSHFFCSRGTVLPITEPASCPRTRRVLYGSDGGLDENALILSRQPPCMQRGGRSATFGAGRVLLFQRCKGNNLTLLWWCGLCVWLKCPLWQILKYYQGFRKHSFACVIAITIKTWFVRTIIFCPEGSRGGKSVNYDGCQQPGHCTWTLHLSGCTCRVHGLQAQLNILGHQNVC